MKNTKSKKALFILHEGVGSTIFNSQVIEHVIEMKELGLEFDILTFDTLKKTWEVSNNNLSKFKQDKPDINIILKKAMNIYYPFSLIYNIILLIVFFLKNKEDYLFIHARADYTAFLCILTKPFHKLQVCWDCRGDTVSELKDSLSRKSNLIKLIGIIYLVNFDRFITYVNSKKCDAAIFVSNALYNLFKKKLVVKCFDIIPCPVSERKFFFNEDLRLKMRERLNILDGKIVYLYSGSMIAYQSLNYQFKIYEVLLKNPDNIIIIATSEPEIAKEIFKGLNSKRLIITCVSFEEMNSYYNLSDFAFLIREKKQLNYVASPTKFGEYCLTGLPVIMNDTVNQAYNISKSLNNYVSSDNLNLNIFSHKKRVEIAIKSKEFYSRNVLNKKYLALYKSFI